MDLVPQDLLPNLGAASADLQGRSTTTVLHAGLAACQEVERALQAAGIACRLEATPEEGEVFAMGALKVGLVVATDDVERVGQVMHDRFDDMLKREGVGALQQHAIDTSSATVTCPACGHIGALVDGACGDCELFLGAG